MTADRLPDFLVAGVRKCATTWLHRCLSEHPQIFVPRETKELYFFDRHWDRGTTWYSRYFRDSMPSQICGELTPGYFVHPEVPARIRATLPNIKLAFLFRNPIERLISMYYHLRALGITKLPFEEAIVRIPSLMDEGLYYRHYMAFENVFGAKACLPLILEDVRAAGPSGLAPLFRFLDVDDAFQPPSFSVRTYERRNPRNHLLAKAAIGASIVLRNLDLHRLTDRIKAAGADRLVFRNDAPAEVEITPEQRTRLMRIFLPEARQLGDKIGRDLVALWKLESSHETTDLSRAS